MDNGQADLVSGLYIQIIVPQIQKPCSHISILHISQTQHRSVWYKCILRNPDPTPTLPRAQQLEQVDPLSGSNPSISLPNRICPTLSAISLLTYQSMQQRCAHIIDVCDTCDECWEQSSPCYYIPCCPFCEFEMLVYVFSLLHQLPSSLPLSRGMDHIPSDSISQLLGRSVISSPLHEQVILPTLSGSDLVSSNSRYSEFSSRMHSR